MVLGKLFQAEQVLGTKQCKNGGSGNGGNGKLKRKAEMGNILQVLRSAQQQCHAHICTCDPCVVVLVWERCSHLLVASSPEQLDSSIA